MNVNLDLAVVGQILQTVQAEAQHVMSMLREKGTKRFERPLGLAFILVAGSYWVIYRPVQKKLSTLEKRIESARLLSEVAAQFKQSRDALREGYARLPEPKYKDRFLSEAILQTLKAEKLTSDSIRPPEEGMEAGVVSQRIMISAHLRFAELMGWLARVEASRPFLHIYSVDLQKSKQVGYCDVKVGIATLVPVQDLTR